MGLAAMPRSRITGERAVNSKALQHGYESWLPNYMAGRG